MKILTLSILASLAIGATAMPAERATVPAPSVTVVYASPDSDHHTDRHVDVDTADTSNSEADVKTLHDVKGDPDDYSNRDLGKDANRTYNQKKNIESDYGKEIEDEITNQRDLDHDGQTDSNHHNLHN